MQHADLIILGGMNEGTAPPQTPPDVDEQCHASGISLPPAHWRVGLAAHDAWMAMSAPDVLITRAERQEGAPTEISRWLRRIELCSGCAYRLAAGTTAPAGAADEQVRRYHSAGT